MDLFDNAVVEGITGSSSQNSRTAELFDFPIDPYVLHIRETAKILVLRKGRKRDHFWRTELSRLEASLTCELLPTLEIRKRIKQFEQDVQNQLDRAEWYKWRREQDEIARQQSTGAPV